MSQVSRRVFMILMTVVFAAALVAVPAGASADTVEDALTDAGKSAQSSAESAVETIQSTTSTGTGAATPIPASSLQEQSTESSAAASSSGSVVDLDALGQEVLVLSGTSSSAGQSQSGGSEEKSSSSEAVLLSVLGQEIWGSRADSKEGENSRDGLLLDVTDQVCEGSGGQLCLSLLYSESTSDSDGNSERKSVASVCAGGNQESASHDCDGPIALSIGYAGAHANEDGDGTNSSSDTAVADACVGSEGHSPSKSCDGPISARVAESHSSSSSSDDSAEAGADNSAADVCVGGENEEGTCESLGVVLLHAESSSSASSDGSAESDGRAYTIAIEAESEEQFALDQSGDISLPPDCPSPSIVCLFLNQVASEAEAGQAGGSAGAIEIDVGRDLLEEGESILGGGIDTAESGVAVEEDTVLDRERRRPAPDEPSVLAAQPAAAPEPGQLPLTGGNLWIFVIMGLGLVTLGGAIYSKGRAARI